MLPFTRFFTKHGTRQWSTEERNLERFKLCCCIFVPHFPHLAVLLHPSWVKDRGAQEQPARWGWCLVLTCFNCLSLCSLPAHRETPVADMVTAVCWKPAPRALALSPSHTICVPLQSVSPCVAAVASLNSKDFCLKDLQFLLAVTATLVGHDCYTLSFCHQVCY